MPKKPSGLMKRKGSDVWQGRYRIPSKLWKNRDLLAKLGVNDIGKSQEFTISTKEHEPLKAQYAYSRKRMDWEKKMELWQRILDRDENDLSHGQLVALAAEYSRELVERYEADPFESPLNLSVNISDNSIPDDLKKLSTSAENALLEYLRAKTEIERSTIRQKILKNHPDILKGLGRNLSELLEDIVGSEASKIVASHSLNINDTDRDLLKLELLEALGKADRSLQDRQMGDYSTLHGLDKAPPFKMEVRPTLTFSSVIERQRNLSQKGIDKEYKSAATLEKARSVSHAFSVWRGSEEISSVTYAEVERWRDQLLEGSTSRTTVRSKIGTIKSLVNWSIRHNKRDIRVEPSTPALFKGENPLIDLELPSRAHVDSDKRTFSKEVAKEILKRSRRLPQEFVFIPWLQAYSGARISEIVTLKKQDVSQYEGIWYFEIRKENAKGVSGKHGNGRRIPLHQSIIEQGFLDFVKDCAEGLIFNRRGVAKIDGRYREALIKVMTDDGENLLKGTPPTHGWRHLFADISEGKLTGSAQYYIEGRSEGTSRDHYGKSIARLPELARMINLIDAFDV